MDVPNARSLETCAALTAGLLESENSDDRALVRVMDAVGANMPDEHYITDHDIYQGLTAAFVQAPAQARSFFESVARALGLSKLELRAELSSIMREVAHAAAPWPEEAQSRSLMVRRALLAHNIQLIDNNPRGASNKFRALCEDLFCFARGTAQLFAEFHLAPFTIGSIQTPRLEGINLDALPTVMALWDNHPENKGVIPGAEHPIFHCNDFDECFPGSPINDIVNGAVKLMIHGQRYGFDETCRMRVVGRYLDGYLKAIDGFAQGNANPVEPLDQSFGDAVVPQSVLILLEDVKGRTQRNFLAKYLTKKGSFKNKKPKKPGDTGIENIPLQKMNGDDRKIKGEIERSLREMFLHMGRRPEFDLMAFARRTGSGIGSLGRSRLYTCIEIEDKQAERQKIILEFKAPLAAAAEDMDLSRRKVTNNGERIAEATRELVPEGDPWTGHTHFDGMTWSVKERSRFKTSLDLSSMDTRELMEVSTYFGMLDAQCHARSDPGRVHLTGGSIVTQIHDSVTNPGDLKRSLIQAASEITHQLRADYAAFKLDYNAGLYDFG